MQTIICKDYAAMSRKAAEAVRDCLKADPEGLISFAGGDTPLGMVQEFVRMVNAGECDISRAKFVMLDEWVGLNETDEGSCAHFLKTNLFDKLERPFAECFCFNGKATDLDAELAAHDAFIKKCGGLTVSVLGVGMNGHLGFNEEGVDFSLRSHKIPLSETTKRVMSKYFGGKALPLEFGITQGIGQIMEAKHVFVIANGEKKADIIRRSIKGEVSNAVPATVVQNHPNSCFILDEGAASAL